MASENAIFEQQGFGRRMGMGERPALLVVDFVKAFNDPNQFGGGNIGLAVARTVPMLQACRQQCLPIAFTRIVFAEDGSDRNLWCLKVPTLASLTERNPGSHVVAELQPCAGELVLVKRNASAFLGTELAGWLAQRLVDTVIVTGCTTSGCVRASVVDAIGLGLRPLLVRDCVGDRALGPHEAALFDLEQKYADVVTSKELIATLQATGRQAS